MIARLILSSLLLTGLPCAAYAQYSFSYGNAEANTSQPSNPSNNETASTSGASESGALPPQGVRPDGAKCVNTFPFFCPPGSTYPDYPDYVGPVAPTDDQVPSDEDDPAYDPTDPTSPAPLEPGDEGDLDEVYKPGDPLAPAPLEPGDYGPDGAVDGEDPESPGPSDLPPRGIGPDGRPCVNVFPFFCPPGSTYPDDPSETTEGSTGGDSGSGAIDAILAGIGNLSGDEMSACEAVLCLAAVAAAPAECAPSLSKYFSIVLRTFTRTLTARKSFLSLCPIVSDSAMGDMIDAIVGGAGQCTVDALNQAGQASIGDGSIPRINNVLPSNCSTYFSHPNIGATSPRYVGKPEYGGFWVDANEFDAAQAKWEEEQRERERLQVEGQQTG